VTSHTASIGLGEPRSFIAILAVGVLIGCVLASTVLFFARPTIVADVNDTQDHDPRMAACIGKVIDVVKPPKLNVGLYERVWRICGNQIYNSLYLEDFNIRRQKFIRQELDERVNLFMVVTMTLSGVILAAIQLFLSFRLALKGKAEFGKENTDIAIEAGKISLKSSITGAVILALSFAFFMVYVVWIYSIREVPVGKPDSLFPMIQDGPLNDDHKPTRSSDQNTAPPDVNQQQRIVPERATPEPTK